METEKKVKGSVAKRAKIQAVKEGAKVGPSTVYLHNAPTSPRKMRLIADLIRGERVNKALNILKYDAMHPSAKMEKLLLSAISAWEAKHTDVKLEEADLFVKEIYVGGGRILKRLRPAPQGRAHRVRKRSNHVTLVVDRMPAELAAWVQGSGLPPLSVIFAILLIYIFLGCVMDSLAMSLLTIPIFYPIVMGLDFWGMSGPDKSLWFGILALMVVEIGLVHPPVGMNIYIINRLAKDVPVMETFKGVLPFLASDLVRIVLLVFFPAISLYLVHTFGT